MLFIKKLLEVTKYVLPRKQYAHSNYHTSILIKKSSADHKKEMNENGEYPDAFSHNRAG
jgi:hypothetical protein